MASSSDFSAAEREAALRRQQQRKGAPVKFLIPLIYAPALPLKVWSRYRRLESIVRVNVQKTQIYCGLDLYQIHEKKSYKILSSLSGTHCNQRYYDNELSLDDQRLCSLRRFLPVKLSGLKKVTPWPKRIEATVDPIRSPFCLY